MAIIEQAVTYAANGVQVTSGVASATVAIPNTADGNKARYVVLICPSGYCYAKPVVGGSSTASVADFPIISTSAIVVLSVHQFSHIAYIQGSAAALLNILPIEY